MKIEKLITLSQFVDKYKELFYEEDFSVEIVAYNDFLKQPLTKEMFVNPFKKPECYIQPCKSAYKEWQEAEKKVIFENCNVDHEDKIIFSGQIRKTIIKMKTPELFIHLRKSGKHQIEPIDDRNWISIKTLHDLAEATNGQLTLKNVEI